MSDTLTNISQISSGLSSASQINSGLENISQIDSVLGSVIAIAKMYTGIENDLIKVEVDNVHETIEAKSKTYVYEQGIAAETWDITHNLNKYPSVTVIDSAGDQVFANLNYVDENELVLNFGAEFTGKAYLN